MSDWNTLRPEDFPLLAIGPYVYRRMMSSPVFTAMNDHIAADLAFRLNSHEVAKTTVSVWPSPNDRWDWDWVGTGRPAPPTT